MAQTISICQFGAVAKAASVNIQPYFFDRGQKKLLVWTNSNANLMIDC